LLCIVRIDAPVGNHLGGSDREDPRRCSLLIWPTTLGAVLDLVNTWRQTAGNRHHQGGCLFAAQDAS
jgi:hypothetical protein